MLVEGRYLVEVRLNGYTNPTGRCRDCNSITRLTCCDTLGPDTTNDCSGGRCDSYFIYCLRPFGDARQPPIGCSESSNEYRNISSVNMDDGPLDLTQSTVLGLDNPQVLSGLEDIYDKVSLNCAALLLFSCHCQLY